MPIEVSNTLSKVMARFNFLYQSLMIFVRIVVYVEECLNEDQVIA